jgi:hypothetical protein
LVREQVQKHRQVLRVAMTVDELQLSWIFCRIISHRNDIESSEESHGGALIDQSRNISAYMPTAKSTFLDK